MIKEDLTASPHITSIDRDLFDFIKNRVKIGLCVSEICFKTIISSGVFLTN